MYKVLLPKTDHFSLRLGSGTLPLNVQQELLVRGIITIFSIALICRKLWSVIQEDGGEFENKRFFTASPFVDVENE